MTNANDIALVRKLRDDNEREIRELGDDITQMSARIGEKRRELMERKLARVKYADKLAELQNEKGR